MCKGIYKVLEFRKDDCQKRTNRLELPLKVQEGRHEVRIAHAARMRRFIAMVEAWCSMTSRRVMCCVTSVLASSFCLSFSCLVTSCRLRAFSQLGLRLFEKQTVNT